MPSCTRHTWASVCLHEQMCVCLLNECCLLFHLALIIPSWQQLNWYTNMQTDPRDMLCASKCVCGSMLNECCLLFHLDLIIPSWQQLNWYTNMQTDPLDMLSASKCVCLYFEWMLFVVPSSPDDGFVCVFIHACLRALVIRERACACTSRCVYVC